MGTIIELPPPKFPAGTRFFDVEGVPVVQKPDWTTLAFDPEPRWFPMDAVSRNGTRVSEAEFRRAVEATKSNPNRRWHGGWPREWPHRGPRRSPPRAELPGPVLWVDSTGNVLVLQGTKSMLRHEATWSHLGADFCRPGGEPIDFDDRWTRVEDKDLVANLLGEARATLPDCPSDTECKPG